MIPVAKYNSVTLKPSLSEVQKNSSLNRSHEPSGTGSLTYSFTLRGITTLLFSTISHKFPLKLSLLHGSQSVAISDFTVHAG